MRLTRRFLALFLLLVIATFHNPRSMTTTAEEAGNPCMEGCFRGDEICRGECGLNMSCRKKCDEKFSKCEASCKQGDLAETPPEN